MALTVDSSLLVEALRLPGPARERITGKELSAPHLIDVEVAHAFRRLERRGLISEELASTAGILGSHFEISRYPHTGLIARAWELRHNLPISDATYVALAEALELPLVTADAHLARAPGIRCTVEVVAEA
jgi:predicted nucleic acid-binding protein